MTEDQQTKLRDKFEQTPAQDGHITSLAQAAADRECRHPAVSVMDGERFEPTGMN